MRFLPSKNVGTIFYHLGSLNAFYEDCAEKRYRHFHHRNIAQLATLNEFFFWKLPLSRGISKNNYEICEDYLFVSDAFCGFCVVSHTKTDPLFS